MFDCLSHPQIRDLAWVACSAPLLDSGTLPIRDPLAGSVWRHDPELLLYRLKQLDADPVPLQRLIPVSRDLRLGNYYERLWHALLTLAPDIRILARNIALREKGRTLGELDLLLETPSGAVIHLELAVKFYLGMPDSQNTGHGASAHCAWLGPDPRDTLHHKVSRLLDHQLQLTSLLHLAADPQPRPDASCAWLQGALFAPHNTCMPPALDSPAGGPAHLWCRQSELNEVPEHGWLVMPHKQWLMPPPVESGPIRTVRQIEEMLATGELDPKRALMLAQCDEGADYSAPASKRLMCMPDAWLKRTESVDRGAVLGLG